MNAIRRPGAFLLLTDSLYDAVECGRPGLWSKPAAIGVAGRRIWLAHLERAAILMADGHAETRGLHQLESMGEADWVGGYGAPFTTAFSDAGLVIAVP